MVLRIEIHGPQGSGKTVVANLIQKAVEEYSTQTVLMWDADHWQVQSRSTGGVLEEPIEVVVHSPGTVVPPAGEGVLQYYKNRDFGE